MNTDDAPPTFRVLNPPARIWLQYGDLWADDDHTAFDPEDITWCADRVHETDVEFVRADLHAVTERAGVAAENEAARLRAEIERLRKRVAAEEAISDERDRQRQALTAHLAAARADVVRLSNTLKDNDARIYETRHREGKGHTCAWRVAAEAAVQRGRAALAAAPAPPEEGDAPTPWTLPPPPPLRIDHYRVFDPATGAVLAEGDVPKEDKP